MKLLEGLASLSRPIESSILTVGNFDGVHVGHQTILRRAREIAAQLGCTQVVMTFEPHPLTVVSPERAPWLLSTQEDKLRMFERLGVDTAVIAHSEPSLLSLTPEEFIRDLAIPRFHPVRMVEGRSFGFGHNRTGNVETLDELGGKYGFGVTVVEPVQVAAPDGEVLTLSSSAVRAWLKGGAVDRASIALGRPYVLSGRVGSGRGRGRNLGFPTANLSDISQLIPKAGVYAGCAQVDGAVLPTAISIGVRPTFGEQELEVEAFLLDFEGDVYDKPIRLGFLKWLRDQQKFSSADELQRQIGADVEAVRAIAATHALEEVF